MKLAKMIFMTLTLCAFLGSCSKTDKNLKPVPDPTPTMPPIVTATPTPTPTPTITIKPTLTPTPTPTSSPDNTEKPSEINRELIVIKTLNLPEGIKDPFSGKYGSPYDEDGVLSNKSMSWYFKRNSEHQPPTAQKDFDIRLFDGYYLGDISQNVIYLTFDQGYENGFTNQILDTLAEKDVKATFFLTKSYIKNSPDIVKRIAEEGHVSSNHSVKHESSPTLTDEEMEYEILETERYYNEVTGLELSKLFRPPMGEYSARTLAITQELGYKTIFWSFAYEDWIVDKQPGMAVAYETVMNNAHNGCIMLLHSVSESNTEALPFIIDSLKEQGFEFKTLADLPENY